MTAWEDQVAYIDRTWPITSIVYASGQVYSHSGQARTPSNYGTLGTPLDHGVFGRTCDFSAFTCPSFSAIRNLGYWLSICCRCTTHFVTRVLLFTQSLPGSHHSLVYPQVELPVHPQAGCYSVEHSLVFPGLRSHLYKPAVVCMPSRPHLRDEIARIG